MLLVLQLLIPHLLTDFVLQPDRWIRHKKQHKGKSYILILHALLAGVLTLIFLQDIYLWYVALFISSTHYLIDLWKLNSNKDNLAYFLLDQIFHLLAISIAWLFLTHNFESIIPEILKILNSEFILIIATAYLIVIFPAGYLVGKATQRWQREIEDDFKKNSLDAAGRYIGIFERVLVLTFILLNDFSAIGFLIAAKSILRFSDKSESGARKQTEYVLIGTLLSFAITILLGLLARYLLLQ